MKKFIDYSQISLPKNLSTLLNELKNSKNFYESVQKIFKEIEELKIFSKIKNETKKNLFQRKTIKTYKAESNEETIRVETQNKKLIVCLKSKTFEINKKVIKKTFLIVTTNKIKVKKNEPTEAINSFTKELKNTIQTAIGMKNEKKELENQKIDFFRQEGKLYKELQKQLPKVVGICKNKECNDKNIEELKKFIKDYMTFKENMRMKTFLENKKKLFLKGKDISKIDKFAEELVINIYAKIVKNHIKKHEDESRISSNFKSLKDLKKSEEFEFLNSFGAKIKKLIPCCCNGFCYKIVNSFRKTDKKNQSDNSLMK